MFLYSPSMYTYTFLKLYDMEYIPAVVDDISLCVIGETTSQTSLDLFSSTGIRSTADFLIASWRPFLVDGLLFTGILALS